jgi:hypothetical protein
MSDIAKSVNQALQDCQNIEASSFYQEFQKFSKLYDSLIQAGFTQRRESLLKTIQDQDGISPFSYNIIK